MLWHLRSPREESGVQSLSPSVAGQARNQDDNLKKTQTQVPDPYPSTHQENSEGQRPHLSLSYDSQSPDNSHIRNGRKVKFQCHSYHKETTLSQPDAGGSVPLLVYFMCVCVRVRVWNV